MGKGAVESVRKQTQQTKHDAAMAKREKVCYPLFSSGYQSVLYNKLKNHHHQVMRDLNKSAHAELELDDLEDEDDEGLVCLICREIATFGTQVC